MHPIITSRNNNFRLKIPQIDSFSGEKDKKQAKKQTRELGKHYKSLELYLTNINLLSFFREWLVCHSQSL